MFCGNVYKDSNGGNTLRILRIITSRRLLAYVYFVCFQCKVFQPSSDNLCMLHNFVAPVINLPASMWIVTNFFLLSVDALSQIDSQYSRRYWHS